VSAAVDGAARLGAPLGAPLGGVGDGGVLCPATTNFYLLGGVAGPLARRWTRGRCLSCPRRTPRSPLGLEAGTLKQQFQTCSSFTFQRRHPQVHNNSSYSTAYINEWASLS